MAMTIKVLALDQLGNGSGMSASRSLYKASTTTPTKTALIKTMRFTCVAASGNVKLNVYFVPSGSSFPTNARRILPKDLLVAAGYQILEDTELTLGQGDSIYAETSVSGVTDPAPTGAWIDFNVAGLERDT